MEKLTDSVLNYIKQERHNQRLKWGNQNHNTNEAWLRILVEEVGEVARAMNENNMEGMDIELTHVAAVAVAWLEARENPMTEVTIG